MRTLEFTGEYYKGGGYRFTESGTYEVDEAKSEQLLNDFPDQFSAIAGDQGKPEDSSEEPPLTKMNKSQLLAKAAEVGLTVTDEMDTNKKLIEEIQKKAK